MPPRWTRRHSIAILANDNAVRRDGAKAFKESTKKAKIVHEEYLPVGTTDFTAACSASSMPKDQPKKAVGWAGPTPFPKIADLDLVRLASNWPPAVTSCRRWSPTRSSRHGGRLYYYFGILKNKVNEWLVARHYTQFKAPP